MCLAVRIAGDLHEIGIHMVSVFFEMDGWDTTTWVLICLIQIISAAKEQQVNVLAISVTMLCITLLGGLETLLY